MPTARGVRHLLVGGVGCVGTDEVWDLLRRDKRELEATFVLIAPHVSGFRVVIVFPFPKDRVYNADWLIQPSPTLAQLREIQELEGATMYPVDPEITPETRPHLYLNLPHKRDLDQRESQLRRELRDLEETRRLIDRAKSNTGWVRRTRGRTASDSYELITPRVALSRPPVAPLDPGLHVVNHPSTTDLYQSLTERLPREPCDMVCDSKETEDAWRSLFPGNQILFWDRSAQTWPATRLQKPILVVEVTGPAQVGFLGALDSAHTVLWVDTLERESTATTAVRQYWDLRTNPTQEVRPPQEASYSAFDIQPDIGFDYSRIL